MNMTHLRRRLWIDGPWQFTVPRPRKASNSLAVLRVTERVIYALGAQAHRDIVKKNEA